MVQPFNVLLYKRWYIFMSKMCQRVSFVIFISYLFWLDLTIHLFLQFFNLCIVDVVVIIHQLIDSSLRRKLDDAV